MNKSQNSEITPLMHTKPGPSLLPRRAGSIALVGFVVAGVAGVARGLPDPGLLSSLSNDCLQFSQDGGTVWGMVDEVSLDDSFVPAPGGDYLQGEFLARNVCNVVATLRVYAGMWGVSDGATGTWRTELSGTVGEAVPLTGPSRESEWGVLLGETQAPRNLAIPVKLYVGIPAAETIQSFSITPGWAFALEKTSVPEAPADLSARPQSPATDHSVTVTGTAEPGSTVEVTVDGLVRCTTTATDAGTFTCDVGRLTRGNHVISATASNQAGTSDPAQPLAVTVRDPGWGWGSLGGLFAWGSLGSLGSADNAGSLGSTEDKRPPASGAGGSAPGSTQGSQSSQGSQTGPQPESGSTNSPVSNPPGDAPGSGGANSGESAGGSDQGGPGSGGDVQSGSSSTGTLPGVSLGLGPTGPGGTGPAPTGEGGNPPPNLGSDSTESSASLGSATSMDRLIHLGGPTVRVNPG